MGKNNSNEVSAATKRDLVLKPMFASLAKIIIALNVFVAIAGFAFFVLGLVRIIVEGFSVISFLLSTMPIIMIIAAAFLFSGNHGKPFLIMSFAVGLINALVGLYNLIYVFDILSVLPWILLLAISAIILFARGLKWSISRILLFVCSAANFLLFAYLTYESRSILLIFDIRVFPFVLEFVVYILYFLILFLFAVSFNEKTVSEAEYRLKAVVSIRRALRFIATVSFVIALVTVAYFLSGINSDAILKCIFFTVASVSFSFSLFKASFEINNKSDAISETAGSFVTAVVKAVGSIFVSAVVSAVLLFITLILLLL